MSRAPGGGCGVDGWNGSGGGNGRDWQQQLEGAAAVGASRK